VDPEVVWAWDRIAVSGGRVGVEELAAEVEWSRKRLWSRFRSQNGLPPWPPLSNDESAVTRSPNSSSQASSTSADNHRPM
jgi:hypothetical protein